MTEIDNYLRSVLTPSLFAAVLHNRIPFPHDKPVGWNTVSDVEFISSSESLKELRRICWPALKTLSKLGLSNIPDLRDFLPRPSAPDFPQQALGLQLLLDQGSRMLFTGVDARYTNGFLDIISLKLAKQLDALPEALSIHSKGRWMDGVGATFEYYFCASFYLIAPLEHSEALSDHQRADALVETLRQEVEDLAGKSDPNRADKEKIARDTYAFSKMAMKGPPSHPNLGADEFGFWVFRLLDVHMPIIATFGRYPYRNSVCGRDSTEAEKVWLEDTNHFGEERDSDVVRRIRDDVEHGRWTPLGEE